MIPHSAENSLYSVLSLSVFVEAYILWKISHETSHSVRSLWKTFHLVRTISWGKKFTFCGEFLKKNFIVSVCGYIPPEGKFTFFSFSPWSFAFWWCFILQRNCCLMCFRRTMKFFEKKRLFLYKLFILWKFTYLWGDMYVWKTLSSKAISSVDLSSKENLYSWHSFLKEKKTSNRWFY